MNILVRNLPHITTEKELLQMFLPFGKVRAYNLVTEARSGKSKGFGFVDMPNYDEAVAAITALDNTTVGERKIRVKVTAQKYEAPARKPEGSRPDRTERRTPSGGTRDSQRPVRRTGRGPATPYSSENRDGTGATWTRSRTTGGSSRPQRTPGRESAQPERSGSTYRARPSQPESQEHIKTFRSTRTENARPQKREDRTEGTPKSKSSAGAKYYKPARRDKQ